MLASSSTAVTLAATSPAGAPRGGAAVTAPLVPSIRIQSGHAPGPASHESGGDAPSGSCGLSTRASPPRTAAAANTLGGGRRRGGGSVCRGGGSVRRGVALGGALRSRSCLGCAVVGSFGGTFSVPGTEAAGASLRMPVRYPPFSPRLGSTGGRFGGGTSFCSVVSRFGAGTGLPPFCTVGGRISSVTCAHFGVGWNPGAPAIPTVCSGFDRSAWSSLSSSHCWRCAAATDGTSKPWKRARPSSSFAPKAKRGESGLPCASPANGS